MPDLASTLRPHLDADPRPAAEPGDRLAAVLALLVGEPSPALLFTQRSNTMSRHAGEVSFPGGLQEEGDVDLRATALRETEEELGIVPGQVSILGALPPIHTHVSATLVTPFVATTPSLPALVVNDEEIARVLTAPIRTLAGLEEERVVPRPDGGTWRGWWYDLPEGTVWGATAFMVHALLELIRREAPWSMS
jgi:8-oxo-dGTP pyrophosphatase MutT (NUDIX family)